MLLGSTNNSKLETVMEAFRKLAEAELNVEGDGGREIDDAYVMWGCEAQEQLRSVALNQDATHSAWALAVLVAAFAARKEGSKEVLLISDLRSYWMDDLDDESNPELEGKFKHLGYRVYVIRYIDTKGQVFTSFNQIGANNGKTSLTTFQITHNQDSYLERSFDMTRPGSADYPCANEEAQLNDMYYDVFPEAKQLH